MNRRSMNSTKVFVGSLPATCTVDNLLLLFSKYGAISECDIANRCGFLHLEDRDEALRAISELNDMQFMGSRISVELGRQKVRRGDGSPPRGGGGKMRGGMNGMGRDRRPYSTDYGGRGGRGGGGMGRGRDYERDYYHNMNSEFAPGHGNDRPYDTYDHRGGMGQAQHQPSPYDQRSYAMHNPHAMPSYDGAAHNSGYAMGGVGRPTGALDDNRHMANVGSNAAYDNRARANMYDAHHAPPAMSGGGVLGERRPLNTAQGMPQSHRMDNYGVDYNRRDMGQSKQSDSYGDRGYNSAHSATSGYQTYASPQDAQNNGGGYQTPVATYSGYGDTRQMPSSGYGTSAGGYGAPARSYGPTHGSYGLPPPQASGAGGGGYGDTYGQRAYEQSYPGMQHQREGYAAPYEQPPNYHY